MAVKQHRKAIHLRAFGVWKLHQKIGYGYFYAIGIGVVGSFAGMLVADYYQGKSVEQMWEAQTQSQLLQDFDKTASDFQLYATRLAVLLTTESEALSIAPTTAKLQDYLETLHQQQHEIQQFLALNPGWLAADPMEIQQLVQQYTDEIETCVIMLQTQLQSAQQQDSQTAMDLLLVKFQVFALGETANRIDQLHQDLQALVSVARSQELNAGDRMETAQGIEKLMIGASMLLSAAIASILAWRTSRAIAEPIEQVTHVAREVADNSDFSLRVNITSDDEIGTLAASLNRLIQCIQVRTEALQHTAQRAKDQADELEHTLETLKQAQAQLVQTEKMSSLGQMVAGIAHEINNPVSFIYGNLEYAKRYVQDLLHLLQVYQTAVPNPPPTVTQCQTAIEYEFLQEDLPKLLRSLEVGAERIRSIVLSLRIFSRLHEAEIKPVDLHEGIESTLVILNTRLKEQPNRPTIALIKNYDDTLPKVECYAGQLNQVFMNLLANAIDALEEKWTEVRDQQPDWQPIIKLSTQVTADHWISIAISDNGNGIPENIQPKIFDPFFTTKAVGKGTGLGMSISYEVVVDKHGGTLSLRSHPAEGTTFIITLPQKMQSVVAAEVPTTSVNVG